jgi:RNA polymerase sigma-54 factor
MKQSINLRLGQHLTMTPQLQQAIRLLQLSTTELELEVQNALDSNLMLERVEGDDTAETTHPEQPASTETASENANSAEGDASESIPEELPVDSNWDDTFDTGIPAYSARGPGEHTEPYETADNNGPGLHEHLRWQLHLTSFSPTDRMIATAIIDAINEDGYLHSGLEEIRLGLPSNTDVELDEIEAVLHRIQQFDPVGVGARNLGECLSVQLHNLDAATPWMEEALWLVRDFLGLLASHDFNQLMRRMRLSEPQLQKVIHLIQSLNPRPGAPFSSAAPQYIIPDVFVFKRRDRWMVELNEEATPRLRINADYANLVRRGDNSRDNNYLRSHLQEARWFMKSLQSRNETLLKVAQRIVESQRGFLEYGEVAMRPLVLRSVADAVNMHESTISRVTTQKYMHTPRGIYEFKYFFSSHVGTADGGECSATAIRALIKKLVAAENPSKPLSDSKIAEILSEQGIRVARRTIAKYREAMSISPSNERKRLA